MDKKIHVFAPIRYGRQSKGSYTMVFSKALNVYNEMGTAFIVPLRNEIASFRGILNQARYLSEAEGASDKKLIKGNRDKWCIIGILFNPSFNGEIKERFISKYRQELETDGLSNHYNDFKLGNEASILNSNGEINIPWLRTVNPKDKPLFDKLDFIIATCPKPNLISSYPSSASINKSLSSDNRDYFYNNIRHGITTFQDREVYLTLI